MEDLALRTGFPRCLQSDSHCLLLEHGRENLSFYKMNTSGYKLLCLKDTCGYADEELGQ